MVFQSIGRFMGFTGLMVLAGHAFAQVPQLPPTRQQQMVPVATPTPVTTPSPSPSPTAAPQTTADGQGPSVPLSVLNKDEALSLLRKPTLEVNLTQLQSVRMRSFLESEAGHEADAQTHVANVQGGAMVQQILRPGLTATFALHVPEWAGIVDIRKAQVRRLLDQQGNPIPLRMGDDNSASNPEPFNPNNILDWQTSRVILQLTTGLPPRGHEAISRMEAEFTVQIGARREFLFRQIRDMIDQELITGQAANDLSIRITHIDDEQITVVAEGAVKRLGKIRFEGMDQSPLQPYADALDVEAMDDQGTPRRTQTFTFFDLPQLLVMKVEYYPQVVTKEVAMEWENVPLP